MLLPLLWGILELSVLGATSAFHLEGSQISYAKFEHWEPCLNGSIRLDILTDQSDGLILYADDGGKFDFLELKLVGGMARLRMKIGDETAVVSGGSQLDDGQWHSLQVQRDLTQISLAVDSIWQTKWLEGDDPILVNSSSTNYVYVGGLPIGFSAKLSALALPSVVFEPKFRGAVRNLVYANCGEAPKEAVMVDSVGVRTNDRQACLQKDPCRNKGVCISTDTGSICDCSRTLFEGQYCQHSEYDSADNGGSGHSASVFFR